MYAPEIYHRPANRFVAEFVGSPAMNFIDGRIDTATLCFTADGLRLPLGDRETTKGGGARNHAGTAPGKYRGIECSTNRIHTGDRLRDGINGKRDVRDLRTQQPTHHRARTRRFPV